MWFKQNQQQLSADVLFLSCQPICHIGCLPTYDARRTRWWLSKRAEARQPYHSILVLSFWKSQLAWFLKVSFSFSLQRCLFSWRTILLGPFSLPLGILGLIDRYQWWRWGQFSGRFVGLPENEWKVGLRGHRFWNNPSRLSWILRYHPISIWLPMKGPLTR